MAKAFQSLTRRSLLGTSLKILAGSSALAVAPALAGKRPSSIEESPALLEYGAELESAIARYKKALDVFNAAYKTAVNNCPEVPEAIVCKMPMWAGCCEREVDVLGKEVWPENFIAADGQEYGKPPRWILSSDKTNAAIKRGNLVIAPRTKWASEVRKKIRTAKQYERQRETTIRESGLEEARDELDRANYDIQRIAERICEISPTTIAGLEIQARAITAGDKYRSSSGEYSYYASHKASQTLAKSFLDVVKNIKGVV